MMTVGEEGRMTKDLAVSLAGSANVTRDKYLSTEEFMNAVAENLQTLWKPHHDALVAESKI